MTAEARGPDPTLEPLLGDWSMSAEIPGAPAAETGARTTFEWAPGNRFLIQRWEVPNPEVPDGVAVIGFNEERGCYLQHYFDSRGLARVYEMTLHDDVWTLRRETADFSPLDFAQRFEGRFSEDGRRISGRWESSADGASWNHDFDLTYTKLD
jgi:hypothetical protein